jgi:hypothetical protein
MQEGIKLKGTVEICLTDENGNVKHSETVENMIVATGLAHIASRVLGVAQAVMGWIAVGTGATAEAVTQTALVTEAARVASTPTNVTTTQTNDTVQHVATFGAGVATGALTEAGIFNAATAGTMLNRVTFAVVNKGAADTMTVTWKVKIA